jgi:hypothetical protein
MGKPSDKIFSEFRHAKTGYHDVDSRDQEYQSGNPIVDAISFADIVAVFNVVAAVDGEENSDDNLQNYADNDQRQRDVEIWTRRVNRAEDVTELIHVGDQQSQVHHSSSHGLLVLVKVDVGKDPEGMIWHGNLQNWKIFVISRAFADHKALTDSGSLSPGTGTFATLPSSSKGSLIRGFVLIPWFS